jgi:hypothetical protein
MAARKRVAPPAAATARQPAARAAEASGHARPRREGGRSALPPAVDDALSSPGRPLDPPDVARFSAAFGHDFGRVRVHTDERAAASADALGAVAYTRGERIAFAAGRYAPGTPEGRDTLAHEAVHVVQQIRGGPPRPGVAPSGAATERQAEQAAALLPDGTLPRWRRDWLRALPGTERPFQVQRQEVTQPGKRHLTEEVGGPSLAEVLSGQAARRGQEPGWVEIRIGETIAVEKGRVESNLLALEYQGPSVGTAHWLQFIWIEIVGVAPGRTWHVGGNLPVSGAEDKQLTSDPAAPIWAIDAVSGELPWYDAVGAEGRSGLVIRDSDSLTMYDRPGYKQWLSNLVGALLGADPDTTAILYTAHADTYLVHDRKPAYHVAWTASTRFDRPPSNLMSGPAVLTQEVQFKVVDAGSVSVLPDDLRAVLHSRYPDFKDVQ